MQINPSVRAQRITPGGILVNAREPVNANEFPTRPQSAKYSPLMYWRHAFRCPPSRAWFKPSASDV
jgi:hypothetical protein